MNGNGTTRRIWENLRNPEYRVPEYFTIPEYDVFSEMVKDKDKRLTIYENLKSVDSKIALTIPDNFAAFEVQLLGNDVKPEEESKPSWLEKQWWIMSPFFQKATNPISGLITGTYGIIQNTLGSWIEGKRSPFFSAKINEYNKTVLENPDAVSGMLFPYDPWGISYAAEKVRKGIETPKDKIEREHRNNIALTKVKETLQKDYAEMHNSKKRIEQWFIERGLMSPEYPDTFMGRQFYSWGMNMPFIIAGGLAGAAGKTALSTGIKALGYPLFTIAEANSLQGEIAGLTGKKDKDGYVIPGTIDLDAVQAAALPGIFAGMLEYFGAQNAISLFAKGIPAKLGWQTMLKSAGKVSQIEGAEEITQDFVGQMTKMGLGLQSGYNFKGSWDSYIAGAFGGLVMAGPGIVYSQSQVQKLREDIEKKVIPAVKKGKELGTISESVADKVLEAAEIFTDKKRTDEEIQTGIENLQTSITEAAENNKENIQLVVNNITQGIIANDEAFKKMEGAWGELQFKEGDKGLFEGVSRVFSGKYGDKFGQIFINAVQKTEPFVKLADYFREQKIENPEQEVWKIVLNHPESMLNTLSMKSLQEKTLHPEQAEDINKKYETELMKVGMPVTQIRDMATGIGQQVQAAMIMETAELEYLDQPIPDDDQASPIVGLEQKFIANEPNFSWEAPVRFLKGVNWDPISKHIADKFFRLNEGKGTPVYFRSAAVGRAETILDDIHYSVQQYLADRGFDLTINEIKDRGLVKYNKANATWDIQFAATRQLADEQLGDVRLEKEITGITETEILPPKGTSTESRQVSWKVFSIFKNPNAPNYNKAKKESFINYLSKNIPPYQANALLHALDDIDKSVVRKEEILEVLSKVFPTQYMVYRASRGYYHYAGGPNLMTLEQAKREVPGQQNRKEEQQQYHEMLFGFPGPRSKTFTYVEKLNKNLKAPSEFNDNEISGALKMVLERGGFRIYTGEFGYPDPLFKAVTRKDIENHDAYMIVHNILQTYIFDMYNIHAPQDYHEQRANDLLDGKFTVSEFTLYTDKDKKDIEDNIDSAQRSLIYELEKVKLDYQYNLDLKSEMGDLQADKFYLEAKRLEAELAELKKLTPGRLLQSMDKSIELLFAPLEIPKVFNFEKMIDYVKANNPFAYSMLLNIQKEFVITGSLALSAFGTVVRNTINPHDFDLVGSFERFEDIYSDKIKAGEVALLRKITDEGDITTHTYGIVDKGYKIGGLKRGGFIILDPEGNVDIETMPVIVDIFSDFKTNEYAPIRVNNFKLADPRSVFVAKNKFGRLKDIIDMYNYILTKPEFFSQTQSEVKTTKLTKWYDHFSDFSNISFGWVRGDIDYDDNEPVARIYEIQSDYFKHGKTTVELGLFPVPEMFLNAVGRFGFPRFALLAAIREYSQQGIKKVRIPVESTVNLIQGFTTEYAGVQAVQAVQRFYNETLANITKKLFGNAIKRIRDSEGREWMEIDLNKVDNKTYEEIRFEQAVPTPTQPEKAVSANIDFQEEKTTGYRNRTIKNASADATIAIATDFNTTGERLTKSSVLSQNKKYIAVDANRLEVTGERVNNIVNALNEVNAKTLNVAGNGIYTIKGKYTQKQIDDFTYQLLKAVIESPNLKTKIESIRTGGQTGFDEAGAKAGMQLGISTMILAPKGWTFRNINGQDISNEQQFKTRFMSQVAQTATPAEKVPPALLKPLLRGKMTYSYGANKRRGITALTTLEAIKKGERTATTRFESQGHLDYWKKAKIGDIIEFEGKDGETVLVKVTKELHKLKGSGKTAEAWSKLEGWSTDYFEKNIKPKLAEAWQIEYELVQTPEIVSPMQRNEALRAEIQAQSTVGQLEKVLSENNIENKNIKPFADWVVKLTANMPIQWVDDDFMIAEGTKNARPMQGNRGAYYKGTVYLNKNISVHNEEFYSTVIHEALHKVINDAMKTNKEFNQGVTALWTEMKYRLSTSLAGVKDANWNDFQRWWDSPEEFADHMMTQTSALHQLAKRTMASNDTHNTFLRLFYGLVKTLLNWMYSKGRRDDTGFTFFEAMETMFNKYLGSPGNIDYWSLTEDMVSEFGNQEQKDVYDELLNPDAQLEDLRAVTAVGNMLLAEKPDIKMDPIAYVQSLSKKDFIFEAMKSEAFQTYITAAQGKIKFGFPFYEYAERLLIQMYNSAKSQRQTKSIVLNLRDPNDPRIEVMGDNYISRGNTRSTSWKPKIPLMDYIPVINELLGNEFEMYFIEGIRFSNSTIVGANETTSIGEKMDRNEYYSDIFQKKGYIFLGTWANKGTAVVLKPLKPIDPQAIDHFKKLYEARIAAFAQAYPNWKDFNSEAKTQDKAIAFYTAKNEKFVVERTIRMLLEDLDKGAMVVEGQFQPFLFNPKLPWTGDAKKILKRAVMVAKEHHMEQDPDTVEKVLNHVSRVELSTGAQLGIGIDQKGLYANTFIFEAEKITPGTWIETIDFHGRQITVDMAFVLKNYFGTPTTDGIMYYLQDGFGQAYETLHGIIKKGSKKLWIGNKPNEPALYGKGSAQKIGTKSLLGKWMQQNNIGLLMSSTMAKYGAERQEEQSVYQIGDLQELEAGINTKSFKLYFYNINRMFEKQAQNDSVKGLQQSFSANMNFEGNDYFEDAGYNDFINELINNLIEKFDINMTTLDTGAIIERLKSRAVSGVSSYERTIAQTILDIAYTAADKEFYDQELDLLSILDQKKINKLRVNKRFSNEKLGNTIGNLFLDPTFSDAVRGYIAGELENLYAFKASVEWHTIRPDIGWLDPSILETVWNQLEGTAEEKWKAFEERIDINTGRLKQGWTYLSETAKRFKIAIDDKTILSIVPSTDMYSQYAVQIAGFLNREQAEDDTVVASSEDIQTRGGRDFDIDQLLHFYYNPEDPIVSKESYLKLWNTINKTSEKHRKELLKDYKEILGGSAIRDAQGNLIDIENMTEKDLYSAPVQVEFTRLASRSRRTAADVVNPFTSMMRINDKFISPVSEAVSPRKKMTMLGRINGRTRVGGINLVVRHPRITSVYNAFSRFTHDFVDIPSNTNAFFYTLEKLRTLDLMYGIRDERGQGLYEWSQERYAGKVLTDEAWNAIAMGRGIQLAQSFLFDNAININSDFVPGARDAERTLAETISMIRQQQVIIEMLTNGSKEELLKRFRDYAYTMLDMGRNLSGKILEYGKEYIENFEFDNLMSSPILNLFKKLDLGIIPNMLVSKDRYAAWELDTMVKMIRESKFKEKANTILDTHPFVTSIIERDKDGNIIEVPPNKLLMTSFLLTEDNPKLHEIKARLVSIMLPVDQTQRYTEKMPIQQYFDIYNLTNKAVFPKLFELLLKKRSLIVKKGAQNTKITLTAESGNYVTITPDIEGKLRITAVDKRDNISAKWDSGYDLLKDDSDFAEGVKYELINEGGIWESSNNRYNFNSIVSFGRNITPEDRLDYAEAYLREILPQLSADEKELLFLSLLGHPDPDKPLPAPTNFINTQREGVSDYHYPTQRHLYELLGRLGEKDFMKRYAEIKHKAYPSKHGFADRMQVINDINNGEDSEVVWFEADIPSQVNNEKIGLMDNLITIYDIIRKSPMYNGNNMAWIVPNLTSETPTYVTNAEVSQTMNPDASDFVGKINDEGLELTKMAELVRELNVIKKHYESVEGSVTHYVENIAATAPDLTSKEIWRAINGDLDKGRWNNILVDRVNEGWVFFYDGILYNDIERLADVTVPAGDGSIERLRFKTVMEFKKIYDYLIPQTSKNAAVYLTHLLATLPANFDNRPIIESVQKLWNSLAERMGQMKGKYYPRIFTQEVATKLMHKHIALQILKDLHPRTAVEELIVRAKAWMDESQEFKDMVEREYSKISIDKFSGFIYSWMKQRSVDERLFDEGDYILDDPIAHTKHKTQFFTSLTNAIVKCNWLIYEEEAFVKGKSLNIINAMHKWYANMTTDQYMKSEKINYSDAKAGDAVAFYYVTRTGGEIYYKGIIKSISKGQVELEMDPEMLERKIRADIRHYEEIHDKIMHNPHIGLRARITEAQKETLSRLVDQGYAELYDNEMTVVEASQAIIDALHNALDDRQNWGKFDAQKVYIKQYHGNRSVHKKGFERGIYRKTDDLVDSINLITTVLFLGAPGSGVKNYTDAMYRIIQQAGFIRFTGIPHQIHTRLKKMRDNNPALYHKLMSLPGFSKFANNVARNELSVRAEAKKQFDKFKEPMNTGDFQYYSTLLEPYWRETGALPLDIEDINKQIEIAAAVAAQYLIEHGYAKKRVLGTEYIPTEELTKKIGGMKVAKSKLEKYGLHYFSGAEGRARRMSAFMFAIKAVVVDKETDVHKIYEIIEKGVARANSVYDMMYRKLGEGSPIGQLLMKFSQFNTNQLDSILMQLEIGKQEGQIKAVFDPIRQGKLLEAAEAMGFNIKMMFKKEYTVEYPDGQKITYRASASKDPLILRRMAKELWQDTIAKTLVMPIANLRTGNPANTVITMALIFLGNFIYHGGELPDEWDLKDWIFTILSFRLGMGITVPADMIYGLASGKDLIQTLPNPRVFSGTGEAVNLGIDLIAPKRVKPSQGVKEGWYTMGRLSGFSFGFNPFPHTRRYYDYDVNQLRQKGLLNIPKQMVNPFSYIPFVNLMEYYDQQRSKGIF